MAWNDTRQLAYTYTACVCSLSDGVVPVATALDERWLLGERPPASAGGLLVLRGDAPAQPSPHRPLETRQVERQGSDERPRQQALTPRHVPYPFGAQVRHRGQRRPQRTELVRAADSDHDFSRQIFHDALTSSTAMMAMSPVNVSAPLPPTRLQNACPSVPAPTVGTVCPDDTSSR